MRNIFALLCAVSGVIAAPANYNDTRSTAPTVTVKNGTIVGSTFDGIDSFSGIPFAQPPVGNLRLKPPQSMTGYNSTLTATGVPTACPQFSYGTEAKTTIKNFIPNAIAKLLDSPIGQEIQVEGEDCLTLNVQRPAGSTSSSLPVVVWIFPGGFDFGSTQVYSGATLIKQSIKLKHEVMYVAVNSRISGFGFLSGKELQAEGSTNLGLRDQRLALEWVAENIEAFGGDPTKVTIWGESSGSISVFDQTVINGGDNTHNGQPLFRGAIMNSGTLSPAVEVNHPKAQAVFDSVVSKAGCSNCTDGDVLACLRALPYETFLAAVNSVPDIDSFNSLNLPYLPRPDPRDSFFPVSPEQALYAGNYSKVAVLTGDQEDEGTEFALSQSNLSTAAEVDAYLAAMLPTTPESISNGFTATYPDSSSAGSPFRTGVLNEWYPQYKRLAAILGDVVFTLRRRQYLHVISDVVNAWSYMDTTLHGTSILGTFHGVNTVQYFDELSTFSAVTALNYFISFINYLDPNAISDDAPLIHWPQYNASNPQMVQFGALTNKLTLDTFRNESFAYLQQYPELFRV